MLSKEVWFWCIKSGRCKRHEECCRQSSFAYGEDHKTEGSRTGQRCGRINNSSRASASFVVGRRRRPSASSVVGSRRRPSSVVN